MQEMQETWVPSLGGEDPLEEHGNPLQGQRSLEGYIPYVAKEPDTT